MSELRERLVQLKQQHKDEQAFQTWRSKYGGALNVLFNNIEAGLRPYAFDGLLNYHRRGHYIRINIGQIVIGIEPDNLPFIVTVNCSFSSRRVSSALMSYQDDDTFLIVMADQSMIFNPANFETMLTAML